MANDTRAASDRVDLTAQSIIGHPGEAVTREKASSNVVCPVCGTLAVQEKCKVICRSEICRGRVIMNCSEF
jgi:hypothetical protein